MIKKTARILTLAAVAVVAIGATAWVPRGDPAPCRKCYDHDVLRIHNFNMLDEEACMEGAPSPGQCRKYGHSETLDSMCHNSIFVEGFQHTQCTIIPPDEEEELAAAVTRGDVSTMSELLLQHRGVARFNAGRSAIQVFDCSGSVTLHVPLSSDAAAALGAQ